MRQQDFDELAESIRQAGKIKRCQMAAPRESSAAMIDWSTCPEVERTPGRVSGSWVFTGTRVPVHALFENLRGGASLDDFLRWFPSVARAQAEVVLRMCAQSLDDASDGQIALKQPDEPEGRDRPDEEPR